MELVSRTSDDHGQSRVVRSLILALVFATPAMLPVLAAVPARDPDVWWHLATGRWIAANGTVPVVDPFTGGAAPPAWVAYSWTYELFVYASHALFGPAGFFAYSVAASIALTAAIYVLVRRLEPRFNVAVVLTTLALVATWRHQGARSFLASAVLFASVLDVLWSVRGGGDARRLLLLTPLFALWANVHIQFVYGLALLGCASLEATVDAIVARRHGGSRNGFPLGWTYAACALAVVATFATPYTWQLYAVMPDLAGQGAMWRHISELQSPTFRSAPDWVFLALALAAPFAIGRCRELVRPFPLLLLAMSVLLAFRATRDTWVLTVSAVSVLAYATGSGVWRMHLHDAAPIGRVTVAVTAVLLVAALGHRHASARPIERVVADTFPVSASEYVAARLARGETAVPCRLYNHLDWGGYLLWALPGCEVSMDGRVLTFEESALERSMASWAGARGWRDDPALLAADVIVARVSDPLTPLLEREPGYRRVFADDVAAVFVPAQRLALGAAQPTGD